MLCDSGQSPGAVGDPGDSGRGNPSGQEAAWGTGFVRDVLPAVGGWQVGLGTARADIGLTPGTQHGFVQGVLKNL